MNNDSLIGGSDTAVAVAEDKRTSLTITADAGTKPVMLKELVGVTLSGRYLVTRKVGQGGMGAVYEATHTLIGKRVAVKVLLEKYAQREAIVARLKQEAQLASSIGNEHIIDITDFGTTEDGRTFVVMEFLQGESLAECLAREPKLSEQRILRIISQAASALAAAHKKDIVHRDIKPENLFLLQRGKDKDDFVKVVDFGISKSLRASGEEEEPPRLTQTGMVLGTPLYMSPEQARGDDELDARVDIYALGVIMYEAATGRVPFLGNNYLSVISQVLNEEPTPCRELRPELSEEFEAVVQKAMAKDRTERYRTAADMLGDLTALLDDPTRSTERAKITGPRRKVPRRNSLRLVAWIAVVAVIIAAVALTVKSLMGGAPAKKEAVADARVAAPPPVDAYVAPPPPPDAFVDPLSYMEIEIITEPPGATVEMEGVVQDGVTPMKVRVVKKDKDIRFVARVAEYNDQPFEQNPMLYTKPVRLKLQKPPKGTTPTQIQRPPPGTGSSGTGSAKAPGPGSGTTSKSGEFGGLPQEFGSSAPPKK
ncbi:MAG: protein kinase [Deltaproteobacteria bacterium]|nr:protein kinase [Deltaproteobacteria bacterium]